MLITSFLRQLISISPCVNWQTVWYIKTGSNIKRAHVNGSYIYTRTKSPNVITAQGILVSITEELIFLHYLRCLFAHGYRHLCWQNACGMVHLRQMLVIPLKLCSGQLGPNNKDNHIFRLKPCRVYSASPTFVALDVIRIVKYFTYKHFETV